MGAWVLRRLVLFLDGRRDAFLPLGCECNSKIGADATDLFTACRSFWYSCGSLTENADIFRERGADRQADCTRDEVLREEGVLGVLPSLRFVDCPTDSPLALLAFESDLALICAAAQLLLVADLERRVLVGSAETLFDERLAGTVCEV